MIDVYTRIQRFSFQKPKHKSSNVKEILDQSSKKN